MPDGAGRPVTGRLTAPGVGRRVRRASDAGPRRLSAVLSPDTVAAQIRRHRVVLIPNPHRRAEP